MQNHHFIKKKKDNVVNKSFLAHRSPGIFQYLEAWNSYLLILWRFHCPSFVFVLFLHFTWSSVFLLLWKSWLYSVWYETRHLAGLELNSQERALPWIQMTIPCTHLFYTSLEGQTHLSPHSSAWRTALITRLLPRPLWMHPSCPWLTHLMLFLPLFSWHFWTITCHLA